MSGQPPVQGSPNSILRPSCLIDNYRFILGTPLNITTCAPGFYCPNITAGNPSTYPQYCPPTSDCQAKRLQGDYCEPQGFFEPMVCKRGFYCPDFKTMLPCPAGSYCPDGTFKPQPCGMLSYCPPRSAVKQEYLGVALALFIDLLILSWFVHYKLKERYIHRHEKHTEEAPLLPPKPDVVDRLVRTLSFRTKKTKKGGFEEQGIIDAFKKSMNGEDISIKLKFQNMSLTLPNGLTILNGVTGEINPGRFTAIMGPSGAGKTTFLNVLMGKVHRTKGDLFINDVMADLSKFKQLIGYVPQEDIMLRELTVRENMLHACRIRAPSHWTDAEIQAYIDALLRALKLDKVAHSLIGDEVVRGISGGQRKRVNIGMELAGLPIAIFLDEPTSGLDSTAALNVASILKNMSKLGLTTVAVVHQPRSEIFYELDDILLLIPGGKTAYLGPREHICEYFENLGYQFDPKLNPADILMDIVSEQVKPRSGYASLRASDLAEEWEFYKQNGLHRHQSIQRPIHKTLSFLDNYDDIESNPSHGTMRSYEFNDEKMFNLDEQDLMEQQQAFEDGTIQRTPPPPPKDEVVRPMPSLEKVPKPVSFRAKFLDQDPSLTDYSKARKPTLSVKRSMNGETAVPALHRKLTRTMSIKTTPTRKAQQASQEYLLRVCQGRGASFSKQFMYCFKRAMLQQYRHILGFVWEVAVASITGFLVGLAMLQMKGILYRGVLVDVYSLVSAAPLEAFVPQTGLIFGMAVCIAAAPAGTNTFGPELVNYYREAAAGHNKLAYYLAKTVAAVPRICVSALHMTAIWYPMATPRSPFEKIYLVLLLQFYGIYGLASIVSMVLRRENQAVLATLAGFFPTTFCGYGPSLNDAIAGKYDFLMWLSYTRWGNEAFYTEELTPFRQLFQVDTISQPIIGYTLDRVLFDFVMMFLIGTSLRVLGYFVLVWYNRSRQR
ncbi:hypothetical protein EDD86DRAFT_239760 [Gorgonomyces haynaldii]|nr:hypothetical protein EDD86DRAFT_239760 [Gorgonomyces haynaldii]